jgi:NitT/TauT family transport system substrate-binding protein
MSVSRRHLMLGAAGAAAAMGLPAPAITQTLPRVRFMMDWAWQGPQSFALVAQQKGYFREAGVEVQLDRGRGSGAVPVELAGGAYQMGYADINPMIRFVAERPETGVQALAILAHANALTCVVRADGPIRTPKDLEGRTLAAPEVDAGRQLFPAFAKANGIDASRVTWMTVTPDLREPMLVQRRADGITGFITSTGPSLARLGMAMDQQRNFRYREFGVPFYSSSIMTTRRFADENPAAVRGVVRALIRGYRDAIRNPDEAMTFLQRHEALTDVAVERGRWQMTIDELINTPEVRSGGLGNVDMARLQRSIVMVEESFNMTPRLQASAVYRPEFLPPREEMMVF